MLMSVFFILIFYRVPINFQILLRNTINFAQNNAFLK